MKQADIAELLLSPLHARGEALLVADENCADFPFQRLQKNQPVLTNRVDIYRLAMAAGADPGFSDFDFSPWADGALGAVAYRISKEKAVVHHIANQARRVLRPGGRLVLAGAKQEGLKNYGKSIGALFGCNARAEKHGSLYRLVITKGASKSAALDDGDYSRLREIFSLNGAPVFSKPGLFGWDKQDAGSALLADYLTAFWSGFRHPPRRLLDLGCGYGYLSLRAAESGGAIQITATDNCAAAIAACRKNFAVRNIAADVVADDCGERLDGGFDAIVCNPPFHQGFAAEGALTEKFLSSSRRLLKPGGRALFVVNAFVPLESLAGKWFRQIRTPVHNRSFKLVELG